MKTEDQFKAWMKKVDAEIERRVGLTHHDLADQPFRDWADDGVTPTMAALRTLRDEGFEG
jgi:hypothetical protein